MKTVILLLSLLGGALHAQDCNVCGLWYPEDNHNSTVEIYVEDGELKGKVYWMNNPNLANGEPILDSLNKSDELRNRPVVGMVFLYGFEKDGDAWENGKVYNSQNGKIYSAEIKLTNEGKLKLTGYIGITLLGKSVYWDKVEG
ncbi:MAG: DUF2147 domain-containing protein [Bacteroidia bacterium]